MAIVALAGQAVPLLIDLFGGGWPSDCAQAWMVLRARVSPGRHRHHGGGRRDGAIVRRLLGGDRARALLLYRAGRAAGRRAGPVFPRPGLRGGDRRAPYALPIAVVTAFVRLRLAPGLAFCAERSGSKGVVWQSFVFPALLGSRRRAPGARCRCLARDRGCGRGSSAGGACCSERSASRSSACWCLRRSGRRERPATRGPSRRTDRRSRCCPGAPRAAVAQSVVLGARALDGWVHVTPRSRGDALAPLSGTLPELEPSDAPRGSRTVRDGGSTPAAPASRPMPAGYAAFLLVPAFATLIAGRRLAGRCTA